MKSFDDVINGNVNEGNDIKLHNKWANLVNTGGRWDSGTRFLVDMLLDIMKKLDKIERHTLGDYD